jgi:hypothetical protein
MKTFQKIALKKFRNFLNSPEVVVLSNRLLIAASAVDNPALDVDTEDILLAELNDLYSEFERSSYTKKMEVLKFISDMRNRILE